MNIFNNTAAGFSKEVDNAMSAFKSTIAKLKANATKAEKLETECTALDGVSTKANNLAAKLEALFE